MIGRKTDSDLYEMNEIGVIPFFYTSNQFKSSCSLSKVIISHTDEVYRSYSIDV